MTGQLPVEDDEPWNYRTGAIKTVRAVRANTGEVDTLMDESWNAWLLEKIAGRPFSDTILIGRAANNDVSLAHSSVSKLHARIRIELHKGIATLRLSDADSSNGTIVNGSPLAKNEEAILETSDLVRFGACVFQVFSPEHMTEVLKRLRDSPSL